MGFKETIMDTKGWIRWTAWLGSILASFVVLESIGWDHSDTLSRYVYTIGKDFPLSIWFGGVLVGGLAVHFFWHWNPEDK